MWANSSEPHQTPRSVVSDLAMYCLPSSYKMNAGLMRICLLGRKDLLVRVVQNVFIWHLHRLVPTNKKSATSYMVKSDNLGHQVNSDIHLQTVDIQMRRLLMSRLIRNFTVCLVNLFFIPIIELWNKQGGCPHSAVCPNLPDFTLYVLNKSISIIHFEFGELR